MQPAVLRLGGPLRRCLAVFACWLAALALAQGSAQAAERVKVGGYAFLPFVDKSTGVTFDLIEALNEFQKDYVFEFVLTSPNRRYRDLASGNFDMVFFENLAWGWDRAQVEATSVFLRGDGEVYVARAVPARDQRYFDALDDKQILGVLGYHYGFANFEADQDKLIGKFRIVFASDNDVSLRNLLAGHGDVAVITRSYLQGYLRRNPADEAKLLVSERYDQRYEHTVLVRKGAKPSAAEIDRLLKSMAQKGVLGRIWARHGIAEGARKPAK